MDQLKAWLHTSFSVGNAFSIPWLFVALCIAVAFTLRGRKRPTRIKALRRALFPRPYWRGSSARADLVMYAFNIVTPAFYFGYVIVSATLIAKLVSGAIPDGMRVETHSFVVALVSTIVAYLAYEFGYWVDHKLKHNVRVLWRFHAVHHSAEQLSPLTNFRIHPVDTIIFANILAVSSGITNGLLLSVFGAHQGLTIGGANVLVLFSLGLVGTLQHTHLWITFPRPLDKILLSPAHHQIHHSRAEAHYNSNLGSTLALFDWMFGSLVIPETRRPAGLSFGVDDFARPHSLRGLFIDSFSLAAGDVAAGVSDHPLNEEFSRGIGASVAKPS